MLVNALFSKGSKMRQFVLYAVLVVLFLSSDALGQVPMNAYSGNVAMGAFNVPLVMTQPAITAPAGMYSGRTPSSSLSGATPICIGAANVQQLNPSTIRMSISVGGPKLGAGAYTASYEAAGTIGGDITMSLVSGVCPIDWPSSITLKKTTSFTVVD